MLCRVIQYRSLHYFALLNINNTQKKKFSASSKTQILFFCSELFGIFFTTRTPPTTLNHMKELFHNKTRGGIFRLNINLKDREHSEDSPRSPPAPTAAALPSVRSPGYHSNSDYRAPVDSHHIINTSTQMASRCGCTNPRMPCTVRALTRSEPPTSPPPRSFIFLFLACMRRSGNIMRHRRTISDNLITVFFICQTFSSFQSERCCCFL